MDVVGFREQIVGSLDLEQEHVEEIKYEPGKCQRTYDVTLQRSETGPTKSPESACAPGVES